MLGLDGLSSAAYGPEAALTILLPLGVIGLRYALPVIVLIVILLSILYLSYRQTIHAYPSGGGSYIVASSNLGLAAGLFSAAALLLDYVLTVSVGISAGVGALISAIPSLHSHILALCIAILVVVTLVNLRGVRESGIVFAFPTYLFVASLGGVLLFGVISTLMHGGHPKPVEIPPALPMTGLAITPWLFMRAFASGCTAMTGVEAVSNGIQAFEKPRVEYAQRTLSWIVGILAFLLLAIAYLCRAFHIGATDPMSSSYQSVLSQLVGAIVGRGPLYYITIFSVIAVLALSANTGFADFPRLCHILADDEILPRFFTLRGRRLVYTAGILVLAFLCGVLLVAFGGITDRLIPLYAIGAFLAFTLSQAGMVQHWRKSKEKHRNISMFINGLGAVSTGIALSVILVAKFVEGAWITVILIPLFAYIFRRIYVHYRRVDRVLRKPKPINLAPTEPPLVLVPVKSWNLLTEKALRFAESFSQDVIALHVIDEDEDPKEVEDDWQKFVTRPYLEAGKTPPELKIEHSPYRRFIHPVLQEVDRLKREHPGRIVAVIVPELVQKKWFHWLLHNQRANLLKAALLFAGGQRVVVISVPWYAE